MTKRIFSIALLATVFLAPSAIADEANHKNGKGVFDHWCAACHAAGPGHPGTQALEALYEGEIPATLENRTDLTPDIVKHFVRQGVSVMPFFRKTEISDAELDSLAAYLARNAK